VRLGRGAILLGGEENHAFFSLVARGCRVVYTPEAVVRHPSATSLAEVRTRQLCNRSAAVAYMALMLVEERRYRRATLKYFAQGILGRRRTWRYQASEPLRIASRRRELIEGLRGLLLYLRVYFTNRSAKSPRDTCQLGRPSEEDQASACAGARIPF
jgi:hypothetical protein